MSETKVYNVTWYDGQRNQMRETKATEEGAIGNIVANEISQKGSIHIDGKAYYQKGLAISKMKNSPNTKITLAESLSESIRKLLREDLDSTYIVFGFKGEPDLDKNHVTLMYFGKIHDAPKAEILGLLDDYFREKEPKAFEALFNKVSMFGPEKDVRVLEAADKSQFLPDLRAILEPYNGSSFKEYNPHYTNDDLEEFTGIIDRVQMSISEYKEIKTWKLK